MTSLRIHGYRTQIYALCTVHICGYPQWRSSARNGCGHPRTLESARSPSISEAFYEYALEGTKILTCSIFSFPLFPPSCVHNHLSNPRNTFGHVSDEAGLIVRRMAHRQTVFSLQLRLVPRPSPRPALKPSVSGLT